jgi:diguanylate cyclase (GGDEF)-like protein/PAS domain S-box-containing protein
VEDGMGGYAIHITLTDITEHKRMDAELLLLREIKEKCAAELVNKELRFQNEEKERRAAELVIANKELGFQNDEKEKRAAELVIANKELTIAATVFESQEGMMVTDASNVILRVNYAFTNITGYSAEDAVGHTPGLLSSGMQSKEFYATLWASLKRLGDWEGEIWNKRKNGELYPAHLCITAVKDNEGVLRNYVATLTDITMSRNAADEIQHLAFYDALTGLPNRQLLLERLKLALASSARTENYGAILFLDLDNFKALNDTLGHDIGDLLLQAVAERLESCVREGDTVARLGGDEFVIIINALSEQTIEAAAQTVAVGKKILAELNLPYQLATYEYHSTTSIGANLFIGHKISIEELLKQSDIAMYHAKKNGRNTLEFFDPDMQESIIKRARMESELHAALESQQFQLYYQLQVDSSGQALGAEALIRWNHPERGFISPVQFIPLAEENGLILPIGHWVLDTACAQLALWQENELTRHLTLSVNVSARQFHESGFVHQVRQVLMQHAINPAKLKLEPTESILLENIEDAVATMNALKILGVQFALDDFGTGFSSLQYLKILPLNQLKIDQSFVRDLVAGANDQAIVRTIIAMAHGLNLDVIAEGVETAEQLEILQQNGCNHFQGYLFGKPVPIEAFDQSLRHE